MLIYDDNKRVSWEELFEFKNKLKACEQIIPAVSKTEAEGILNMKKSCQQNRLFCQVQNLLSKK